MKLDKSHMCAIFAAFAMQFTFGNAKIMAKDMIKLAGKDTTCTVYEDESFKNNITYINPLYSRDAALLKENDKGYQILVAGVTGWIKKDSNCGKKSETYDVKEISNQQRTVGGLTSKLDGLNVTRYQSYQNKLYLSAMVYASYEGYFMGYTELPEGLSNDKVYYSYDGIYFYDDYNKLINDYRAYTRKQAVNANKPYFNYYQYVSTRSKSNISAAVLDQYLLSKRPDANTIIEQKATFKRTEPVKETLKLEYKGYLSSLYKKGSNFVTQQDNYNINVGAIYGMALNESGYGTSRFSLFYNNPFGYGAVDSNPDNATIFTSINKAVSKYYGILSDTYANPQSDFGERGTQLGSKAAGMNVRYASDPLWGYKNAYNYRKLDELAGTVDFNKTSIGILKDPKGIVGLSGTGIIRAYNAPNANATSLYYYTNFGTSVSVVDEAGDYYKVINETGPKAGYAYIQKDYVYLVGKKTTSKEDAPITKTVVDKVGNTYYIWGKNNNGQLGNGNKNDVKQESKIALNSLLPKGEVVNNVIMDGLNNVFVLTNSGNVYTSGVNTFGQRGISPKANAFSKLDILTFKATKMSYKNGLLTLELRNKPNEFVMFGKNAINGKTGKYDRNTKTLVWMKKDANNKLLQVRYYNMSVRKKSWIFNFTNKKLVSSVQCLYNENKTSKKVVTKTFNKKGLPLTRLTKNYDSNGKKINQKMKYY